MNIDDYPEDIKSRLVFEHPQKRGPKSEEQAAEEANPTTPKVLIGITKLAETCEDCNQEVTDRQTTIKKYQTPYAHWKNYCSNCQMYKDPTTGTYTLNQHEIAAYHRQAFSAINQAKKSKIDK
jgi:hypothetical protein